jgi:hypothetical protein
MARMAYGGLVKRLLCLLAAGSWEPLGSCWELGALLLSYVLGAWCCGAWFYSSCPARSHQPPAAAQPPTTRPYITADPHTHTPQTTTNTNTNKQQQQTWHMAHLASITSHHWHVWHVACGIQHPAFMMARQVLRGSRFIIDLQITHRLQLAAPHPTPQPHPPPLATCPCLLFGTVCALATPWASPLLANTNRRYQPQRTASAKSPGSWAIVAGSLVVDHGPWHQEQHPPPRRPSSGLLEHEEPLNQLSDSQLISCHENSQVQLPPYRCCRDGTQCCFSFLV